MVRNTKTLDPDSTPPDRQVGFDAEGPRVGPVRLARKKAGRWVPAEQVWLERELVKFAAIEPAYLQQRLDGICRAMNAGDVATAAIATEHLMRPVTRVAPRHPSLQTTDPSTGFAKASPDDPKRPGWPAGSPDGRGGKFRPIEGPGTEDRAAKRTRLLARRGLRSMLRRILTIRRVARIMAELFGDTVPGLEEISAPATVIDALKLKSEVGADAADTEAAVAFLGRSRKPSRTSRSAPKPRRSPPTRPSRKKIWGNASGPPARGTNTIISSSKGRMRQISPRKTSTRRPTSSNFHA